MVSIGLILKALLEAASSWDGIADHLTVLINKGDAIFDPHQHGGLLFDDSTFSRSRLYFWAIDCLDLFIPSVAANIREWEDFWEARISLFEAGERLVGEFRKDAAKYGDKSCQNIFSPSGGESSIAGPGPDQPIEEHPNSAREPARSTQNAQR
jgi:hypothetical protein